MAIYHNQLYEFGRFRLDPANRQLYRDDQPVDLEGKAFDLLVLLVQRPGELVTKKQIMDILWPETFVEEGNIQTHISTLRKKLGARSNRIIKTVRGKGYKFTLPVQVIPAPLATTLEEIRADDPLFTTMPNLTGEGNLQTNSPGVDGSQKDTPKRPRAWRKIVLTGFTLALLLIAAVYLYRKRVEANIRHVVQDSQIVETLQIYTNPEGFDKNLLTKYWLPEEQGGVEITRVKATVEKLLCEGARYGKDAKLEQFSFRSVKVASFGFGKSAIVETEESWYLPKYKNDGSPVPLEAKNLYMKTTPKYELRKVGDTWLIVHTGVPRRRSLPCPSPTPSPQQ